MTSNSVHEQNCPIQVTCKYCPNDTKCNEEKSSLDENILGLQNVTRFGAVIEYSCPLGMEFEAQKPPATTTECPVELGRFYQGPVMASGPSSITSWEDCQIYCRNEQVKYFSWSGTGCRCRDVKLTMVNWPSAVYGQAINCGGN